MFFNDVAQLGIGPFQRSALVVGQGWVLQRGHNLVELSLKQFQFFAKHGDLRIMSAVASRKCCYVNWRSLDGRTTAERRVTVNDPRISDPHQTGVMRQPWRAIPSFRVPTLRASRRPS